MEGLVGQHLMAWKDYTKEKHTLNFWRTRSGLEVDFVVLGLLGFWAIEVKLASRIFPADLRGLHSFVEDYENATPIILYREKKTLHKDGILCIPCDVFFKDLTPDVPLIFP